MKKFFPLLVLGLVTSLTACASAAPEPTPSTSIIKFSIPDPLPADVTASGVVLAGILLTSGDIAKAVEEGLISPAEVDLARIAVKANRLGDWADLASQK
ncbi:MAG: hypothetical protein ACKOWH_03255 [Rhodoluna sp.]